jgi:hypothetical protein
MVARMVDSGGMNEQEFLAAEPMGRMGTPEEIGEGVVWHPVRRCLVCHRAFNVDRWRLCRPMKIPGVSQRRDRLELRIRQKALAPGCVYPNEG